MRPGDSIFGFGLLIFGLGRSSCRRRVRPGARGCLTLFCGRLGIAACGLRVQEQQLNRFDNAILELLTVLPAPTHTLSREQLGDTLFVRSEVAPSTTRLPGVTLHFHRGEEGAADRFRRAQAGRQSGHSRRVGIPGSPAHAAPCRRVQAGERRAGYTSHSALPWPQEYQPHRPLHRAFAGALQRLLGRLTVELCLQRPT
ncbi:MAG: hypothetical protein BWX84_00300 [Verrucomicrobia bacterium ADurb.Bin118]|nr:MAG: hypothetical protein BWX84_00300 [Verrucomicrobia bacterium ADurb.Bin118]